MPPILVYTLPVKLKAADPIDTDHAFPYSIDRLLIRSARLTAPPSRERRRRHHYWEFDTPGEAGFGPVGTEGCFEIGGYFLYKREVFVVTHRFFNRLRPNCS